MKTYSSIAEFSSDVKLHPECFEKQKHDKYESQIERISERRKASGSHGEEENKKEVGSLNKANKVP